MGLFDKLNELANAGAKKLSEIADTVSSELQQAGQQVSQQLGQNPAQQNPQAAAPQQPAWQAAPQQSGGWQQTDPSGDSWGPQMPAEPNQYNFNGNYVQYFESILREEFGGYAVHTDASDMRRRTVFTLQGAMGKALVIEVMTENSEARKVRRACEKEGVPYVRFYFDHDGWWNTRSYVTRRIRSAIR